MTEIRPFTLAIEQDQLDDLNRRLDTVRWPDRETVDDWSQGTPLAVLQDLVAYWREGYDWRKCESRLNSLGQFVTELDGLAIHFLHVRSPHENALPLLITHGWPGSIIEFMRVIAPLTDPVAHGGKAQDAFHVIAPSLPGYAFSGKPTQPGWGAERIARAWAELMTRLGYGHWVAQGGDWGSLITYAIGMQAPAGCAGIHLNMPIGGPTEEARRNPTPQEMHALERMQYYQDWDSGYSKQQQTRPQSLGYGLVDSPVGLAGWIYEKLHGWSDNDGDACAVLGRDAVLDNIMLYWLPATGASAARLYWESFARIRPSEILLPSGISVFPKEITPSPRAWVERRMKNIVHWNELDKGGHFAAWEQPELFVNELRTCFARMR
ncbi:MAG: epoxide hydrolase [Novosphingobium sp.]|nr:epoxide hydrolase [Novosphingobium sp.]MCP5402526.1 epoxide hydrolase [Novosphingobium sp.]